MSALAQSATHESRRGRRLASLAAGALLIVLFAALVYGTRMAGILVAYKAKQLCSGVFVAGRDPRSVVRELEADDLELLR